MLALDMFQSYAEVIVSQVQQDWDRIHAPKPRHSTLQGWVREFFNKASWFDQHFARGSQGDVPRALHTIATREFRSHGLDRHEPVLTVGPPDNFETHKIDLRSYLFDHIPAAQKMAADFPRHWRLSVISVPYIEGTRALWHPIVIGHEIGHLRIESDRHSLQHLLAGAWIDPDDAQLAAVLDTEVTRHQGALEIQQIRSGLENWVDELLCDLNAVRLFGAAGISAIADFLSILLGTDSSGVQGLSRTHPPLSLRVKWMIRFLELVGHHSPPYLEAWKQYAYTQGIELRPRAAYVQALIDKHFVEIAGHALRWGDLYIGRDRGDQIEWLSDELLDDIPGGTHCLSRKTRGGSVFVADVVNAAWNARQLLDDPNALHNGNHPRRLLESSTLDLREKRLQVDELATKAIDSLEFALLWSSTGHQVINLGDSPVATTIPRPGTVLGADLIQTRLLAEGDDRLIVTPLLEGAVHSAGLDIRLSPEFIVFRHSATQAFDPLSTEQDPRTMQELVHKGWGNPFILHPGEHVLAATLEYIGLPRDVAAQVVTRSSYGRLGLITATAVQVQPGSRNSITLELVNHGSTPIALTAGTRVAQLVLMQMGGTIRTDVSGKYIGSVGPEFSRVDEDPDAEALRAITRTTQSRLARDRKERLIARFGRESITFVFEGSGPWAQMMQTIAESEGASATIRVEAELPDYSPDGDDIGRLSGVQAILTYMVAGSASVSSLVAMIIRLCRAWKKGVIATVSQSGGVRIDTSDDLPRGMVLVVAPENVNVQVLVSTGSGFSELVGALSASIDRAKNPPGFN